MPFSALSRCLACILALVAGLVVPGGALVHGYAHHAAAHEHHDHHDHHEHGSAGAPGDSTVAADPEHGGDHPHPQMARAVVTRLSVPNFVAVIPTAVVVVDFGPVAPRRPVVAAAMPRADPARASPLHSRAPPLG